MNVTFYQNKSDPRTINKSLTSIVAKTAMYWKEDSSILTPKFKVAYASNLLVANYCYITEMARYYFITDIVAVSKEYLEITAKCDVLETYKTPILALTCTVKRQEKKYNVYMDDDKFIVLNKRQVQTKKLSSSAFSPSTMSSGTLCFVLAVAGGA